MAEAAVEERPPARFYCHMCNVEFQNDANNFTCPHCSDGFIEELQEIRDSDSRSANYSWDSNTDDTGILLASRFAPGGELEPGRSLMEGRTLPRNLASSNLRTLQPPIEHLVHDFIINLGVGVNMGGPGNVQLFLGNPGDYAWGREGLDAIVSQLLNQMDSAGPPPVSKAVIDGLQVVEVTQEQVAQNMQCSVCWEQFQLKELVRQLPCLHIYHESCIRPWLELHGTCPICRQNLTDESGDSHPQNGAEQNGSETSVVRPPTAENIRENVYRAFLSSTPSTSSSRSNQMDQSESSSSSPTSYDGSNLF
ncbi:E3 ubiquitin-protein ligase Iruka-like isoform X1 [Euwallacea similis]|uniref:E3 ubiquitin-protein ligase Iruka-like isoform X1 n=1 Tax=Euwallacea similis TaxID=1736056 RepID=UPI00344CFF92